MLYYAVALTITLIFCYCNTTVYPMPDGAQARSFRNTRITFVVLLPLAFLALFRWDVGVDSLYEGTYWVAYQNAAKGVNSRDFELGFYWFMRLFSGLGIPYFWFLFAHGLLFMIGCSCAISRGSVWSKWSILIFFLLAVYFDSYSSLRQSLAESVCLIAWARMGYDAPSQKKDLHILLLFLAAGLLHSTAWMNIPIYLVCKIRFSRSGLLKFSILSALLTPFLQVVLRTAMRLLAPDHYTFVGVARINALMTFILFVICWYFYDGICALDENAYMYINLALCIAVLILNSGAMYLPYRVFDMLKVGYVFIIPYLLRGITNGRIRLYVEAAMLLIFGAWFANFFTQNGYVADYQMAFRNWSQIVNLP